ncbi:hypothetical protein SAMN05192539_10656 [Paraburkholderia diazotrophica]|uniref:Uncharacterized protein n=1 Tax=Paraburkholderia diazotrophica TaxID=667676 RepID=A0A1H7EH07_9BURK|nr:hypothetical protein SAMN05192539_10656 [Paraburkholderia diazotrophica]
MSLWGSLYAFRMRRTLETIVVLGRGTLCGQFQSFDNIAQIVNNPYPLPPRLKAGSAVARGDRNRQ